MKKEQEATSNDSRKARPAEEWPFIEEDEDLNTLWALLFCSMPEELIVAVTRLLHKKHGEKVVDLRYPWLYEWLTMKQRYQPTLTNLPKVTQVEVLPEGVPAGFTRLTRISPYGTQCYLRLSYAVRRGHLQAIKVDNIWYVEAVAAQNYPD